jgi:hypothetical protein
VFQRDNVSIEAEDADGALIGAAKSGGAAAAWNSVVGFSWCSVETGSSASGASESPPECEGSGTEASGNGATDCGSIKEENETSSGSRAGTTGFDRGGTGKSAFKDLGASPEKVDNSSGREGSSDRRAAVGCGKSDSLIASVSAIDPLASLKIEG